MSGGDRDPWALWDPWAPGIRTPNLRIKSPVRTCSQRAVRLLSRAFRSLCIPSFPFVPRSFTGMTRGTSPRLALSFRSYDAQMVT